MHGSRAKAKKKENESVGPEARGTMGHTQIAVFEQEQLEDLLPHPASVVSGGAPAGGDSAEKVVPSLLTWQNDPGLESCEHGR